jgi:hypothetical protein
MAKISRTGLKNPFAPLWGLRGLNLTAEDAKKREEDLTMELPICILEMDSRSLDENPLLATKAPRHEDKEEKK